MPDDIFTQPSGRSGLSRGGFYVQPIPALYHSACSLGDDRIEPGDYIVKTDDGYAHEECAIEAAQRAKREPAVCATCHIAHAGDCY